MTPIDVRNRHIANSIERALLGQSYLDPEILKINGFATATQRHLFSNLCHIEGLTYLEIGTFCGATFVAAFNNNPIHAIGVDDFTQPFEQTGVREQLEENLNLWKSSASMVTFIDHDCWQSPLLGLKHKAIDIFYYDGEHSFESQSKALPVFFHLLADRFIFIVDDFQWDDVARGTKLGFEALAGHVTIEKEWHLNGERMHDDPIWWNGVAIYLCSKVKPSA